ncbi:MAG: hypothetical protein BJ554DRAFT_6803 [Olpidium bornovanus]|uniref:Uncharacterized protein n=1 Tax=Olpidium bornovanus TaxID=278681 RepID=A0A8H8DKF8_9FUNG|nr:MAG: hypothetical protein BJ554DRAFT_6803 [Olpidium bornovanus]
MRRCSPESPDVGRLLQLLAKVVYDDADPAFSRRCGAANRLAAAVAAPGGPSGSDLRTLAEAAFFGRRQFGLVSLERAFDAPSSPASYKFGVAKCLATVGVALGAEAELFVTWIFKRLAAVPDEPNRADVERERKVWLLAALREAVRYPLDGKEADALAPSVRGMLAGITSFLEKMEAFDYLGSIITILEAISTRFPDAFGQAFPDVVDLLVSWHIDPRLSDHLQNAMSDAYLAFEPFWKPHLSLAVEIMVHLIKDIEQSAAISSYRQGSSRLAAELEQPNGEGRSERAKPLSKDDAGVCTCALGTFCAVTRAVGPSLEGECGDDIELRIDTIRKRALRAVALVTERIGTSKKWLALGFKAVETLAAFRKRTWYDAQLDAAPELAAYLADPNGCLMRMRTAFGNCPRIFSSCLRLLSALFDSCAAALSSEQVCGIIRRLLAEANLMVAQVAARARRPSHSAAAESPHWSTAMSLCCSEPIYFGMPPQCPEAGDPNGRRTSSTPSVAKPVAEALLTFDVMLVEKVLLSSGGNADTAGHVVIALLALLLRVPLAVSLHMIAEYLLNRSVAAEIREASFEWLQDIVHRASREQSGRAVPTGAVRMIELLMAEALTAISSEGGKFRARLLDLAALCSRKLNVFVRGTFARRFNPFLKHRTPALKKLRRLADSEEAVRESCFRFLISLNPVTTILEGIPAEDFNAREFQVPGHYVLVCLSGFAAPGVFRF